MATQDHIHLSDTIGSAPENAPNRKWKVHDRERVTNVYADIAVSLTGTVYAHVTKRAGTPIKRYDYNYLVKVKADGTNTTEELQDILDGFAGKELYLVDNRHPADGADHAAYVKRVLLARPLVFKADVNDLSFYWVEVALNGLET